MDDKDSNEGAGDFSGMECCCCDMSICLWTK